jgi:hypothetical protein
MGCIVLFPTALLLNELWSLVYEVLWLVEGVVEHVDEKHIGGGGCVA